VESICVVYNEAMKSPLFVRPFAPSEREQLEEALRAANTRDAFHLRRVQYLLASAQGQKPAAIAATYGGCEQTVRNVVRAFNATGLECLFAKSHRPKTVRPILCGKSLERLEQLLHQCPRTLGKSRSIWTQRLLAEVLYEEGLTEQPISQETVRRALKRLNANWKRAKHWITSPDPHYALKKSGVSG
jgi:transposase